jgi:peptidoglycan hydrolase-like protein with peptidoglycan-binding domain
MFLVHYGEMSPRVTLLQILLNADGAKLGVDGHFGARTHAAVVAYQRSVPLRPDGKPGPRTWESLLSATNLAVVSSVDLGDAALLPEVAVLKKAGDAPIVLGGMCNGVTQLIGDVVTRASGKSIATLRLTGHGNLGRWMTVSVGDVADLKGRDYAEIEAEKYSYIAERNFNTLAPLLRRLAPLFAPFGFMEHHGCSLGKRPATRRMMRKLADLWNVPISVGVWMQNVGQVLDFAGPVVTVFPNGTNLVSWSRQFQNMSVRGMVSLAVPAH